MGMTVLNGNLPVNIDFVLGTTGFSYCFGPFGAIVLHCAPMSISIAPSCKALADILVGCRHRGSHKVVVGTRHCGKICPDQLVSKEGFGFLNFLIPKAG